MENTEILATIFIPVYNQEELIIKALDSLPVRSDIEILILDDASTDNTLTNVLAYKEKHPQHNIEIISYKINRGLGAMKNEAYTIAKGIYIGELDSDDYVYTDKYNEVLNQLDKKADIVYMNLQVNNGEVLVLNNDSKMCLCGGPCKFIKKSLIGDTRCPETKEPGEDFPFNEELQKKPHIDKFTNIAAYHYNFPRMDSLYDQMTHSYIENKISVIIPVKDRKENTKKLLDELTYQKREYYPETQIIVIENNSTEDMSFLKDYVEIELLQPKNLKKGVSAARNLGLERANGEYITFIDNDDFISKDYLHTLYQTMRNTNCDWCTFPWLIDGQAFNFQLDINKPLESSWAVWAYCYNRRIIKDIKFNEDKMVGEDIEWNYQIITPNTKGIKLNNPIYHYTWENNNNSLSHLYNDNRLGVR